MDSPVLVVEVLGRTVVDGAGTVVGAVGVTRVDAGAMCGAVVDGVGAVGSVLLPDEHDVAAAASATAASRRRLNDDVG